MPDGGAAVHPDDVMLLAALRRGNGDAAAAVMQRHNRALWRIARGILGDDGEAEEAVQDTWLRAFTTSHAYRGEAWRGQSAQSRRPLAPRSAMWSSRRSIRYRRRSALCS